MMDFSIQHAMAAIIAVASQLVVTSSMQMTLILWHSTVLGILLLKSHNEGCPGSHLKGLLRYIYMGHAPHTLVSKIH